MANPCTAKIVTVTAGFEISAAEARPRLRTRLHPSGPDCTAVAAATTLPMSRFSSQTTDVDNADAINPH